MRILLLFLIPFYFLADAQVKEINFLGKTWNLVGYDFRLKPRVYSNLFFVDQFKNANFPSAEYLNQYNLENTFSKNDLLRSLNTLSAGAVFRPFMQSKLKFVKQIEIAHNVELEHISDKMISSFINGFVGLPMHYTSTNLGYNPRFIICSPTIAESLKFYVSGDAYVYLPLGGYFYTNPDDAFLLNGGGDYTKGNGHYSDRINSSSLKYGTGLSLGVKVNLNCNWNFHLEGNAIDIYTRHSTTKKNTVAGIRGVQFGLRYKFGTPSEEESESRPSSTFW